jgi:hypothetical protein
MVWKLLDLAEMVLMEIKGEIDLWDFEYIKLLNCFLCRCALIRELFCAHVLT